MTNSNTGSKYEMTKGLGVAAIAKLVRADIKALLPQGLKASVRCSTYSMGRSIRVCVTEVPTGFEYWTAEYLASDTSRCFEGERLTVEASVTLRALERVLASYNYNNSDMALDYYDVSFSGSVSFDESARFSAVAA